MPYKKNADLPDDVKKALPAGGQTIWRSAFNSAMSEYKDEGKAAATAWAAVKAKYKKGDGGTWELKEMTIGSPVTDPAKGTQLTDSQGSPVVWLLEEFDLSKAEIEIVDAEGGGESRRVWMTLVQEGWSKNGHYYRGQNMEQIGEHLTNQPMRRKMFKDHLKPGQPLHERKFDDWSGTIEEWKVESSPVKDGMGSGYPRKRLRAKVKVHDAEVWKRIKEAPDQVGASVDLYASVKEDTQEGRKGRVCQEITDYRSTDFVLFPAAGGRVERLAASEGHPADEGESTVLKDLLENWVESAEILCADNLKMAVDKQDSRQKFWRLQSAMEEVLRMIGETDDLTDDEKKKAMVKVVDDFATEVKKLDLMAMYGTSANMAKSYTTKSNKAPASNNKEGEQEGQQTEPEGGGSAMADQIKTVAALQEAYPELFKSATEQITAQVKKDLEVDRLKADLTAAQESAKTLTAKVDELQTTINMQTLAGQIETALTEAKIPATAVTDAFRTELTQCKTLDEAKTKIADRKQLAESLIPKGTDVPPYRPTGVTTDTAPAAQKQEVNLTEQANRWKNR